MIIEKQPQPNFNRGRSWSDYPRARDALCAYINSLKLPKDERILLPNYIGFSKYEGSGVLDPVTETGVNFDFYELDARLNINLQSVEKELQRGGVSLLVIIHYFGYVDPCYKILVALAKSYNVLVLEDQAHSLLTDLYGGVTGRLSDASIYSLHKIFGSSYGGALSVVNVGVKSSADKVAALCLNQDLVSISERRIRNAKYLAERLAGHDEVLSVLRPHPSQGIVPQTFPILIENYNRDLLYERMNTAGFGVVSLYHTMVSQIADNLSYQTNVVSRKILNLPVHQDAQLRDLDEMTMYLLDVLYQVHV